MMRTLRFRLFISILLPIILIVPVVGLGLNYLMQTQVLVAGISNELIRQAVLVADISGTSVEIWQDSSQAQAFVTRIGPRLAAKLMLLDPDGHLIVSSDPADAYLVGTAYEMPDLQKLLSKNDQAEIHYDNSQIVDVTVPVVETSSGRLVGFVRLTNPLADIYARSEQLQQVTLYVVIGGILAGLLLGWFLVRDLERPLKKASAAMNGLSSGQQPLEPLKAEGPDEVRELMDAFNVMVGRLKASEESRKRLLANMVHELGRPLGAMLSALQALRGGADREVKLRDELLQGMESEIFTLQRLLNDLTHLDHGSNLELQVQSVSPTEWLARVLSTWEQAAAEKKLEWKVNIPADLPEMRFDPSQMAQALGNLVSNAIHYTPGGGRVEVTASCTLEELTICVADSGPGISEEEQELIFKTFYRGQTVQRFSDGMGLGLPIARDLVKAHGGRLYLESQAGKGSRFYIVLPIKNS